MIRERHGMKAFWCRGAGGTIIIAVCEPGCIFHNVGPRCQKYSRSMSKGTRAFFAAGGEISSARVVRPEGAI